MNKTIWLNWNLFFVMLFLLTFRQIYIHVKQISTCTYKYQEKNNLGNLKESSTMLSHENHIMWCQRRGFLAYGIHMMNKVINWSFYLTKFNQSKLKSVLKVFWRKSGSNIIIISWWHEDDNWSCWVKYKMNMIMTLTLNK